MLQCKNVTKKYMKMTAVNGVSIDFMPGRIYALLGSNGSGYQLPGFVGMESG